MPSPPQTRISDSRDSHDSDLDYLDYLDHLGVAITVQNGSSFSSVCWAHVDKGASLEFGLVRPPSGQSSALQGCAGGGFLSDLTAKHSNFSDFSNRQLSRCSLPSRDAVHALDFSSQ